MRKISTSDNLYFKPRKPKLSDIELISLIILAEFKSLDSEYQLFREIQNWEIATKIERSVYNRRKRKLFFFIEQIRLKLVQQLQAFESYFVVDSMPLEVCKMARSAASKICKETPYAQPDHGYCASHRLSYYGYKLHAVCSIQGVFQCFDLAPASVHDIHYLQDIKSQLSATCRQRLSFPIQENGTTKAS
ncbi:Transposase DDE domain-containing protein [Flexibacter flexilis DSM 6793]|uniref:Transposase DDE domain-containing protein n=1 Tax=Flexibacter flexilis DSM 6793 TaxID=927664 RepID=A0A1I1FR46_9BACT|nr:Transposase DDE domain-containing protein [Flexibacter flexilis DSM 6793]